MVINDDEIFRRNISLNYDNEEPFDKKTEERIYLFQKQMYIDLYTNILDDMCLVSKENLTKELDEILARTLYYIKSEARGSNRYIHKIIFYDTEVNFEKLLKRVIRYHESFKTQIIELKKAE